MVDPFGTILSWSIIIASAAFIAYHLFTVLRNKRLEIRNGAAIMFFSGWLILELPQRVYDLPADALDDLNWLGIVVILVSIALEFEWRFIKRNSRSANQTNT